MRSRSIYVILPERGVMVDVLIVAGIGEKLRDLAHLTIDLRADLSRRQATIRWRTLDGALACAVSMSYAAARRVECRLISVAAQQAAVLIILSFAASGPR